MATDTNDIQERIIESLTREMGELSENYNAALKKIDALRRKNEKEMQIHKATTKQYMDKINKQENSIKGLRLEVGKYKKRFFRFRDLVREQEDFIAALKVKISRMEYEQNVNDDDDIIKTDEAAKIIGCHPKKMTEFARKGVVPAHKIGFCWRFSRSNLKEFVRNGGHR